MMLSQALKNARRYEEEMERAILPEDRPAFHLSARVGWMNDPNGFSRYGGKYHMFYQYHPYDSHWGPMHWGHAVSEDLLHWEYLPAAMAPDMPYDKDGCFSGGALELADGRQMLMYTGVLKEPDEKGFLREVQRQCVAFGDGIDYEKYEGNPVLTVADLPEGADLHEFRDPHIWQDEAGVFHALTVNYSSTELRALPHGRGDELADGLQGSDRIHENEEGGRILLFRSGDGLHWTFDRTLAVDGYRIGRMWECPDLFTLDNTGVLLASAMDMLATEDLEYDSGNGTFCLLGDYDPASGTFVADHDQAVDYGIDFYAEQTLLTPDGRRVMIAWMQNWDAVSFHAKSIPWFGQMTLPRELSIRNGRLCQWPVRELDALRSDPVQYKDVAVCDEEIELEGIRGRILDLELTIEAASPDSPLQLFTLQFAKDGRFHTALHYNAADGTLEIDRKYSGSRRAILHQRRAAVRCPDGKLSLRIILDRYSAEVFINGGEQTMTATLYTPPRADRITFSAAGSAKLQITKYALRST